jgi:WD40 repeat protein
MRLLPRSRGGTWLLASAAWLAACAVAWPLVPVAPRAEWPLDGPALTIGFVPGGHTLLAGTLQRADDATVAPLRAFDADSGRVTDWLPAGEPVHTRATALAPDGRRVVVARGPDKAYHFDLIDVATGRPTVTLPHDTSARPIGACFSPDGRRLAYAAEDADGRFVRVWDLSTGSERCLLRPGGGRLAFAPGVPGEAGSGRTLAVTHDAAAWSTDAVFVRLWDTDTGKLLRAWHGPRCRGCGHLLFAPAGDKLAAVFHPCDWNDFPKPGRPPGMRWSFSSQVRVYDVAGDKLWRAGCDRTLVPPGRDWLAVQTLEIPRPADDKWDILDYHGDPRPGGALLDRSDAPVSEWLGPGGRLLAVAETGSSSWANWLARVGIRLPFARGGTGTVRFVDVVTGETVGALPPWSAGDLDAGRDPGGVVFAPADDLAAVLHHGHLAIWDIPPRTSRVWFAGVAVALAVPPAWLARRRLRRLRRTT